MQAEGNTRCDSESPSGRVQDIRRQWALHEDEALAHRLQDEEITHHYAGNRTRNAIVREDGPKAREEQRREEQEALEQRLRHLSILQRQAEEDARVAQELAKKYQIGSEDPSLLIKSETTENSQGLKERKCTSGASPQPCHSKADLSMLGAACLPSTSSRCRAEKMVVKEDYEDEDDVLTEDDIRILQEKRDAEMARKVQEELEQYDKDRRLAIEAQDRELAKMLYEKEKARLKRAKERARMKAELAATPHNGIEPSNGEAATSSDSDSRAISRNSNGSAEKRNSNHYSSTPSPPRIPEKSSSRDNPIGFKANPKALPPQPQSSMASSSRRSYSSSSDDPVPPYMPIHGYNRSSPKRPNK